jgi:hypothetical protein
LNRLQGKVRLHRAAVSDEPGECRFLATGSLEAHLVSSGDNEQTEIVKTVTLDETFAGERIDILKIDVEGHEEMVLRGAQQLLRTASLRPRLIFIEVHPYAWHSASSGSASLLGLLDEAGYRTESLDGAPIVSIESYGEIIAKMAPRYMAR